MRCTATLDIHVDAASDTERDRLLGILKNAYGEGRDEASLAATLSVSGLLLWLLFQVSEDHCQVALFLAAGGAVDQAQVEVPCLAPPLF